MRVRAQGVPQGSRIGLRECLKCRKWDPRRNLVVRC